MIRKVLAVLVVVALAVAGGAYWYFEMRTPATPTTAAAPTAMPPMPVEAQPVALGTVIDEIAAVGSLRSNESVVLRPEIAGRISAIHFTEGQAVDAGTLLFSIDDSVYRAELQEAEARLALSERNERRARELYARGAGTARARDEAEAQLAVDRAAVALARARIDKTRIAAPFDGIIGLRRVSVGDYVNAGEDLANLEDITPLKVDFRVPERFLSVIETGRTVAVQVDAFPGRKFEGSVYAVDPLIDADGRSIAIRARLPNEDRTLRPGLFARVNLLVAERTNAMLVPENAIVPRGEDKFVFVVENNAAVLRPVELGQRRTGDVEILSGLKPGDIVVTAGQIKIRDGAPVAVVNSQAKAGV